MPFKVAGIAVVGIAAIPGDLARPVPPAAADPMCLRRRRRFPTLRRTARSSDEEAYPPFAAGGGRDLEGCPHPVAAGGIDQAAIGPVVTGHFALLTCSEGIPIVSDQKFPEPTVGAVIFDAEGRFLLLKSHKFKGQYVIPGGHIELGETMELRREIREETGLTIHDIELVDIQEFIYDEIFWKKRHFIFLDYRCRTEDTEVVLNEEAQEYEWVTLDESRSMPVEPYTRHTIDACFRAGGPVLPGRPTDS